MPEGRLQLVRLFVVLEHQTVSNGIGRLNGTGQGGLLPLDEVEHRLILQQIAVGAAAVRLALFHVGDVHQKADGVAERSAVSAEAFSAAPFGDFCLNIGGIVIVHESD